MKSGTFEYFGDGACLTLPSAVAEETNAVRRRGKEKDLLHRGKRGLGGHGTRGLLRRLRSGWTRLVSRAWPASAKASPGAPVAVSAMPDGSAMDARIAALSRYFYC